MTSCFTFSYSVPMHVMRKYNAKPQRICIFFFRILHRLFAYKNIKLTVNGKGFLEIFRDSLLDKILIRRRTLTLESIVSSPWWCLCGCSGSSSTPFEAEAFGTRGRGGISVIGSLMSPSPRSPSSYVLL